MRRIVTAYISTSRSAMKLRSNPKRREQITVCLETFEWILHEEMEESETLSQLHELAWKLVNLTREEEDDA